LVDKFSSAVYRNPDYQDPEAKTKKESVTYGRMKALAGIK